MHKSFLVATLATMITPLANAGYLNGELDGTYRPIGGSAETLEIGGATAPEQLGDIVIYLEREDWNDLPYSERIRVRRYLIVYGQLRGLVDPTTFLAQHVLVNDDRGGALFTENDFLIPESGDPFCSTGTPMTGIETVNIVRGSGVYQNLIQGQLKLSATINNCASSPEYGQNDFVILEDGFFEFSSEVSE